MNELLNRFPLSVENPYQYRGTISQKEAPDFDNIQSGWLKHLEIEDLCDVLVRARRNLPKTDFMYNDDNLIDETSCHQHLLSFKESNPGKKETKYK